MIKNTNQLREDVVGCEIVDQPPDLRFRGPRCEVPDLKRLVAGNGGDDPKTGPPSGQPDDLDSRAGRFEGLDALAADRIMAEGAQADLVVPRQNGDLMERTDLVTLVQRVRKARCQIQKPRHG